MNAPATPHLSPDPFTMPLDQIDVSNALLFQNDTIGDYFKRLRRDAPVHLHTNELHGRFWSITRWQDIMAIDTNHAVFSSEDGISIRTLLPTETRAGFITMDPPKHDDQRKTVSPIVAPANLVNFEKIIRGRVCTILDGLPINQEFDWVERVSIELTTQMLATLFDFPFEDRRLLTYWSDVATADFNSGGPIKNSEMRMAELMKCQQYYTRLWNERVNLTEPGNDLISMLAHSPATRNMPPLEFLGNLILLIVGGNDTTRNSITGGLLALHNNPTEYQKLRDNPALIPNMVSEIIRYQTPLAHMRRTANQDYEFQGQKILKGDKVIMWYLSGNRDESVLENPDAFIIDRPRARQHLSFGFGIHRCVGNRLAELQLKILWEEIMKRFPTIEVVGEAKRVYSTFVHGFESMPVRIPARV